MSIGPSRLMNTMGFGPYMSHLILLLGQEVVFRVMLNKVVALDIAFMRWWIDIRNCLTKFIQQGCPIRSFLFALAIHPLLVMLSRLATYDDIVGLALPYGGQLVAKVLKNDSFMLEYACIGQIFLHTQDTYWLGEVSLILCTKRDLECWSWQGLVVEKGSFFNIWDMHWLWKFQIFG